jgi:protein arginine N-methyltransferase 1
MSSRYSVTNYGEMIEDSARLHAHASALRELVKPGSVVLDIGAGTGILSLLACRFGAGEVHAVEPDDVIELARAAAAANGFADRIHFHQAISQSVELPRRADVIVSDLRGVLPPYQHHIAAIVDARERLLAPGGALVPQRDTLWLALADAPALYRRYARPWFDNEWGFDLSAGGTLAVNNWRRVTALSEQVFGEARQWAVIDYSTVTSPNLRGEASWHAPRGATVHGLLAWFDAELGTGAAFSNAPGRTDSIYGQAFFPLQEPVTVDEGDLVAVEMNASLVGDDYVWGWNTSITDSTGSTSKALFRQSTFRAEPLSAATLSHAKDGFVPALGNTAEADLLCLSLVDGRSSLRDIAARLVARAPRRFESHRQALAHLTRLLDRYRGTP